MILRLELPKPTDDNNISAKGIIPYLDNRRLYRIRNIDFNILECPMRKIDEYTYEFDGEFEVQEVDHERALKVFDIYAK